MRKYEPSARIFPDTAEPCGWAWQLFDGSYAMTQLNWEPEPVSDARIIMLFESQSAAELWAECRDEAGKAVLFTAQ